VKPSYFLGASLAALTCGGCADRLFRPAPVAPVKRVSKPDKSPDAKANLVLDRLGRAVEAWSKAPPAAGKPATMPRVYVDATAIARRLPAWRLAQSLENRPNGTGFAWNESFATRPISTGFGANSSRSGSTQSTVEIDRTLVASALPARLPEATARADRLPELDDVARRRQNNAFALFLRDAAQNQRDARFDRAEISRAALDEEVQAAQQINLEDLTPAQLGATVQLELTNLRLQLLTASVAEQERLRTRIAEVETAWQVRLRAQESERLAELARLRNERPARIRREGEAAIKAELAQGQTSDTLLRNALRDEHVSLVSTDFARASLSIGLPPANLSPSGFMAPSTNGFRAGAQKNNLPVAISAKTFSVPLPSERGGAEMMGGSRATSRASQLRRAALIEANTLVQSVARRKGWSLIQSHKAEGVYRDETAAVLREITALS
jgi:hypothetical protein